MGFFERLSNGWTLAMNSFKVLKENKQLVIFPILSGISLVLVMGSFILVFLGINGWPDDSVEGSSSNLTYYLYMFIFYLVNYFVVVFFNMALIHCTRLYFRGEEVSVKDRKSTRLNSSH